MKTKKLIILILILFACNAFAQKDSVLYNSKKRIHFYLHNGDTIPFTGKCLNEYYKNSELLRFLEIYKNGVKDGTWIGFSVKHGDTLEIMNYKNNLKHGIWKSIDRSQKTTRISIYVYDKEIECKMYDKNGKLFSHAIADTVKKKCYRNYYSTKTSLLNGADTLRYFDSYQRNADNENHLNDLFKYENSYWYDNYTFYPNGALQSKTLHLTMGYHSADSTISYYQNGMKKDEVLFMDRKQSNPHYYYDSTGILIRKSTFSEIKTGTRNDGRFTTDSLWNHDRRLEQIWTIRYGVYDNDTILKKEFYENGALKSMLRFPTYEKYYLNGKVAIRGDYSYSYTTNKKEKMGSWYCLDSLGNKTKWESFIHGKIHNFNKYGLTQIYENDLYGLVDESGKIIVPCKYSSIEFSTDTNAIGYVFSLFDKTKYIYHHGFMNADGSIEIAESTYKSIHYKPGIDFLFLSKELDYHKETYYTIYDLKNHKYRGTIGKIEFEQSKFFTNQINDSCLKHFKKKLVFVVENNQVGMKYSRGKTYRDIPNKALCGVSVLFGAVIFPIAYPVAFVYDFFQFFTLWGSYSFTAEDYFDWFIPETHKNKYIEKFYLFDKNGKLLKHNRKSVILKN